MTSPAKLPPVVNHPPTAHSSSSRPEENSLLHSRSLIFGLLFGVTGVLGLPLLWYSPVFNRREKWLWSVVNVIYTAGLVLIAFGAVWFAMRSVSP